jgi:MFS family permease
VYRGGSVVEQSTIAPAQRAAFDEFVRRNRRRNFFAFGLYTIAFNVGWLFKTESVIIAAFVRTLGASNLVQGLFPMVNQLGSTIPQLFMANRVEHLAHKKPLMLATFSLYFVLWFAMFLVLSFVRFEHKNVILGIFLLVNTIFALNLGCNSVVGSIIFGKVVPYNIRGKLMTFTGVIGGVATICCTFLIVRPILDAGSSDPLSPYAILFLLCSLLFLTAWFALLFIKEPPLAGTAQRRDLLAFTRHSLRLVIHDRNFIILFLVGALVSISFGVLQFYTVYAKSRLQIANSMLAWYLVFQVGLMPLGSVFYGTLADRYGNRLGIRIGSVIYALIPAMAVLVGSWPELTQRPWLYCIVYAMIGFNLPLQQILTNYLLEITPLELHPNYLGVYNALRSITLVFPPAIGLLMDIFLFDKVFLGLAVFLSLGIVLAYLLVEPRHLADKDEYKEEMALG